MTPLHITRRDTAWLKGIAITLIFLHNYCHWLPRCVAENEYTFRIENTWKLVHYMEQGGPHLILNLFSYFGHYGVPIFLFLSGYGLVRKYERDDAPDVSFRPFLQHNVLKLWKLMVGGVLLFILSDTLRRGAWMHGWDDVCYLLTFVSNLLPHRDLLLGPWWFFSLILQLYLCYYFVFRKGRSSLPALATAGCLLVLVVTVTWIDDDRQQMLDYLRYNFIGSMLPFAAGIWAARTNPVIPRWVAPLSLVLLVMGGFNVYLWLLTPLFAVTAALPLLRIRYAPLRQAGEWIGTISAALFVMHPVLRPYFIDWARHNAVYPATAAYIVACLTVAWAYQLVINKWK